MEILSPLGGWIDNLFPLALKALKQNKPAGKDRDAPAYDDVHNHSQNHNHHKFFARGYGDIELLIESEKEYHRVISGEIEIPELGDQIIVKEQKECHSFFAGNYRCEKWQFESSMASYLPEESKNVICEYVVPSNTEPRAVVILFPATGDKFFATRRNLISIWLLRHNIASISIMAPCYGTRKPKGQRGHYNDTVSLYYRATNALLLEGAALAVHVRKTMKVPVVLSGMSWGGAMASGVGLMLDGPIGVVSSVGCPSAKVLATGLLQHEVNWEAIDIKGHGSDSAKDSLKEFILDRSFEMLVDDADIIKTSALRNRTGLRLWCGLIASDDAFVHLEEGRALESVMRTLFTVGLEEDEVKPEPEEAIFTACSPAPENLSCFPRVDHHIIPGGHTTSMLSAPFTLVPEIVRMVDRLCADQ